MEYNKAWESTSGPQISRRRFLQTFGGMVLGSVAMAAGGWTYITKIEPTWVDFTEVKLRLPRLNEAFEGFRLVQITDIHMSVALPAEKLMEVCDLVLEKQPDLVVMTGDYLYRRRRIQQTIDSFIGAVQKLTQTVPVVGVLGNHDYRTGASRMRQMLAAAGIRELQNDVMSIERGGSQLHIAGVDDPWMGRPQLDTVVAQLPKQGAAILLAHEPDYADKSSATGRFDLQLSGHSHGGQVVLPLIGPPLLPHMGEKYPSGLYQVGTMLQYTSRGLGMVDPFVRFNCRPEVTMFTLSTSDSDLLTG